jgi:2-oxoglutarate ferredoxin oxidoreductase subunit beta
MSATLVSPKTFVSEWPTWCPGCGDFGVLRALQNAAAKLGLQPHEICIVTGIGCSGKINSYFNSYGLHTLHGRSLPVAQAVKLANPHLTVIAAGGDGDGYGIGAGHFLHAVRRNVDITYVVMDNQVYGLTKGQTSPTSPTGFQSTTTPHGSAEGPVRPLRVALANGCSWIAQGFSANLKQLTDLLIQAIQHKGFSLLNVQSPCVTWRETIVEDGQKVDVYEWFKKHLHNLDEDPDHDPRDRAKAFQKLIEYDDLVTGLVYCEDRPAYTDLLPGYRGESLAEAAGRPLDPETLEKIAAQFR